jgi:CBS domain-containing protein
MAQTLVREVMSTDVLTCTRESILYDAVELMALKNIGAVVVEDEGRPVGIVTERDILKRVVLGGLQVRHELVRSVYTPDLVSIRPDQTIHEVVQKMFTGRFRHLPVVEDGKVIGMISSTDVVRYLASR